MLSTSSPKNSILKGKSLLMQKTSIIPPRTANWPLPSTFSVRSNPNLESLSTTSLIEIVSLFFIQNS